jgi:ATP-dependent helicase/nuclease subunit A
LKIPSEDTFTIYRSSAGSGKTYQLAMEFVALAVKNPNLFNKILAVTFTNKATREMKERILDFLQKLVHQADKDLQEQVIIKTGLPAGEIIKNAVLVNEKILHNYSEFSISTIDAFFQKIVKSFAKELGLLGNFKVELDQDKVMEEIIDQIIDDLGREKELTGWLVDFSFSKVDENKAWNIRPEIESLAGEIFKESFRKVEKEIADGERNRFRNLQKKVVETKRRFEGFMISRAEAAIQLIKAHELAIQDFAYGFAGPSGYFDKIINKKDFKPPKRITQVLEEPDKWSTKSSPKKEGIKNAVNAGLQEISQALVDYYTSNYSEYATAIEIQKNLYVFGILSRIIEKLKAYRQEHDVMLISDVAVFLNRIIAENDAPFIYEKTGSWYRHYLIDEFQDTSGYQWENFRPLLESGLSEHQKSMVVGDGKQSIYRWRGGDWDLIIKQVSKDLKNYEPVEKHLDTNWRSDKNIIAFNNVVFSHLKTLVEHDLNAEINEFPLPTGTKDHLKSMSSDIEKLYHDVVQKPGPGAVNEEKGIIEINAYQKTDEESWKVRALNDLPSIIEKLQDRGFQASDITILVRKSDDGKKVIEKLLRYKNSPENQGSYCYDAISNESLFLNNSSAIRLIINAMKFGLDPKDEIARAELNLNHHIIQNRNNTLDDLAFIMDTDESSAEIKEKIQSLINLPVYEMVERIVELFDLTDAQFNGYIQAFQDLVLEYFADENRDLGGFLEWWEEKGKRKSVQLPDKMNAIRVMTIHKSKGLEFKAVILPFCDWKLDHESNKSNYIWCRTDREPFDQAGYLPLKYSKSLADSYFATAYYQEKIKAYIDNLNLLYVALTRAESYLLINCPPQSKNLSNVGDLIVTAMENISSKTDNTLNIAVDSEDQEIINYHIGENKIDAPKSHLKKSAEPTRSYKTTDWRDKIAIRKKGGQYLTKDATERRAKINYGILVHEILASSKNEDDADEIVDRYFTEGVIGREEKLNIKDQLQMIFSNPKVQGWFNTQAEIKTEIPILINGEEQKRPDRVLIDGNKAVIIDFKTGVEKQTDKNQVIEYCSVLQKMGYDSVEAYLLYISRNKVVKVA